MPAKKDSQSKDKTAEAKETSTFVWIREFIESLASALVLAFIFRAFVAEAFVIPTGSMAPTLMGAHKDVTCSECGFGYQCGASQEFNDLGAPTDKLVLATTCPLCRFEMPLDLRGNGNHQTFSGDRILVSKFAYLWKTPQRWDVIVFKFPDHARQNYIKRLIGLPNEGILVRHGDIYTTSPENASDSDRDFRLPENWASSYEIARKLPSVVAATLQPLSDTRYRSKSMLAAGIPDNWQPDPSNVDLLAIEVDGSETQWKATFQESKSSSASSSPNWLRYYPRVLSHRNWRTLKETGKPRAPIEPYSFRFITDFTHYNAGLTVNNASAVTRNGALIPEIDGKTNPRELPRLPIALNSSLENDGVHWVPDLAGEFVVNLDSDNGKIHLRLIEAGVRYNCTIDASNGTATFRITKGSTQVAAFDDGSGGFIDSVMAQTPVQGAGSYRIRFANVDDQLLLWVNGKHRAIMPSGTYRTAAFMTDIELHPHFSPNDPMDAAPVMIGFTESAATVTEAKVFRDIYYIATNGSGPEQIYSDYLSRRQMLSSFRDAKQELADYSMVDPIDTGSDRVDQLSYFRDLVTSSPSLWKSSPYFLGRRSLPFTLYDKQYFPMGDNSQESFDARSWPKKFVPERLMLGRAMVVFWPHHWRSPVPYPNFRRMGLIH